MRNIGETEIAIADRFFFALQELVRLGVIRGVGTFAQRHNLNKGNLNVLKNNTTRYAVKTEFLAFIAEDYGVSCEWLLLGNGEMFKNGSPTFE